MMTRILALVLCVLVTPFDLVADEALACGRYGPRAWVIGVADNTLPTTGRFYIMLEKHSCGGFPDAPEHAFRIVDGEHRPLTATLSTLMPLYEGEILMLELTPDTPLPEGTVRLEMKAPKSSDLLGDWKLLEEVQVIALADTSPPSFEGKPIALLEAYEEEFPLRASSETYKRDSLRTTLIFQGVQDETSLENLLYIVDYRPEGGSWSTLDVKRGASAYLTSVELELERTEGFGETGSYRITIRDRSGNHTTTLTEPVEAPSRP